MNDIVAADKDEGYELPVEEILFTDKDKNYKLAEKPFDETKAASHIALIIVSIFGGSLLVSFILLIAVVILAIYYPDHVTGHVVPALGGDLMEIFKVIGGLFSPLLAFILGYYFKKDSRA